jgi:hypothetical protein
MSRSSLSQFPQAFARTVAERFPRANRLVRSRQENGLDTDVKANSGANLNRPWLECVACGVLDGCWWARNQAPCKNFITN